jgi:hypothetical protein
MSTPFGTQYYPDPPPGGGALTANSVDGSHITNGSITTADIADGAITFEKIASNAVTNTRIGPNAVTHAKIASDAIENHNIKNNTITYNKLIPFGIIRIINESPTATNFSYQLGVYNTIAEEYDGLAFVDVIKQEQSVSHFYQTPFNVNMKLVVGSAGGVGVQSFNILQGATQVSEDGNELIFEIDTTDTNYQNIEIGVNVAI